MCVCVCVCVNHRKGDLTNSTSKTFAIAQGHCWVAWCKFKMCACVCGREGATVLPKLGPVALVCVCLCVCWFARLSKVRLLLLLLECNLSLLILWLVCASLCLPSRTVEWYSLRLFMTSIILNIIRLYRRLCWAYSVTKRRRKVLLQVCIHRHVQMYIISNY